MIVSAIVAVAENGVIGRDNTLPWRLPADLQEFKRITLGHHIVMGRKNHQDIGRPLPGRVNVVLSRSVGYTTPGCVVAHSLTEALDIARAAGESECFIVGGAEIYREALPLCQRLYWTEVHAHVPGDVFFPDRGAGWQEVSRVHHAADEKHAFAFSFVRYERTGN